MAISSIGPPPSPPAGGPTGRVFERDPTPEPELPVSARPAPDIVEDDPADEADPSTGQEPAATAEPPPEEPEDPRETEPGSRLDVTA